MYYSKATGVLRGAHAAPLFVETVAFTRRVIDLGLEDALRGLQLSLVANPCAGATDAGTGGLRKIRMPSPQQGKGKRGGVRVHYLFLPAHGVIYLLFAYAKSDQDALSRDQKRALRLVAERIQLEWTTRG